MLGLQGSGGFLEAAKVADEKQIVFRELHPHIVERQDKNGAQIGRTTLLGLIVICAFYAKGDAVFAGL